ncbi:hypothetical protein [uncultured Dokdonia sp.]|uniref:hypothetical protein n=1 Tax=uncultured Dokdonia sp. TaxID=575653 RepID=UPI002617D89A|nr:hypothetical protein [uncultured Dokdonia sp.]
MKNLFQISILLSSIACFGQHIVKKTTQIDTIKLQAFEEKNIIEYKIENAIIYISAEKYLTELIDVHTTYKELVYDIDKNDARYDDKRHTYRFIDSIKSSVENGIKKNNTIRLTHKIFEKETLNGLANFRVYINKGDCVIFDLNGVRQYTVIRKTVLKTNKKDYASEWSYFYLLKEENPFLIALNWIT